MRHARGIASKKTERDDVDVSFRVNINRLPKQLFQLLTVKILLFGNHETGDKQCLLVMANDQYRFRGILSRHHRDTEQQHA